MSTYIKKFFIRGAMFAWAGPVICAIVWFCLKNAGVVSVLPVEEVVLGVISSTFMAFIAAGISIVHAIEQLPKPFAGLIQAAVLYFDYLGIYLLNGWIPLDKIWIFSLIFIIGFLVIWLIIYISIRHKVNKLNRMMKVNK